MKRPKDILSHPWHIQEYINDLERKNSSLHSVMRCYVKDNIALDDVMICHNCKSDKLIKFDIGYGCTECGVKIGEL
tara:strand:- start:252 stop:479 length:228 start_codon:yes stop_codon:yes gene_type:complete